MSLRIYHPTVMKGRKSKGPMDLSGCWPIVQGRGGVGQERCVGRNPGWGVWGLGVWGRTFGGTGGRRGSILSGLIEVVFRNGLGLGGGESGCLIEVVREGVLCGLYCVSTCGLHVELSLGRSPGGMDERGLFPDDTV